MMRNQLTDKTMRRRAQGLGFSLIEAIIATVILGLGVTALLSSVAAGTRANAAGARITHAAGLAQEIREWTLKLPFSDPDEAEGASPGPEQSSPLVFVDDLDDLIDVTFSPPRNGQGSPITDMTGWSQKITLTWRDPGNLSATVTPGSSDIIYVNVDILLQSESVLNTGWIVAKRE